MHTFPHSPWDTRTTVTILQYCHTATVAQEDQERSVERPAIVLDAMMEYTVSTNYGLSLIHI